MQRRTAVRLFCLPGDFYTCLSFFFGYHAKKRFFFVLLRLIFNQ